MREKDRFPRRTAPLKLREGVSFSLIVILPSFWSLKLVFAKKMLFETQYNDIIHLTI